jgi:hypothetical protein
MLMDHPDAECDRVVRVADVRLFSVDPYAIRITVDFPAPFSPTIAWIVPFSTLIDTSLFATTLPKVLVTFLSSSMC